MTVVFNNLKSIGDQLDLMGLNKSASVVTNAMGAMLQMKKAQYVGGQGYWIRNRRCWDNCYRQKRSQTPEKAAQEVWFSCWDEYLESINDNKSGWEKYAGEDAHIKTATKEVKEQYAQDAKIFHKLAKAKIDGGMPVPNAIYATIAEGSSTRFEHVIDQVNSLVKVADNLHHQGKTELSQHIYDSCLDIIKEAQFGGKGFGGFMGNLWNRVRHPSVGKHLNISERLKRLMESASAILQQYRRQPQQMQAAFAVQLSKMAAIPEGIIDPATGGNRPPSQTQAPPQAGVGGPQSAVSAPQRAQQGRGRGQINPLFAQFRQDLDAERAWLAQAAQTAMQTQKPQTAQLIQGALNVINQYYAEQAAASQANNGRSAINALDKLVTNIGNTMAGLEQVEAAEEQQATTEGEPAAETPPAAGEGVQTMPATQEDVDEEMASLGRLAPTVEEEIPEAPEEFGSQWIDPGGGDVGETTTQAPETGQSTTVGPGDSPQGASPSPEYISRVIENLNNRDNLSQNQQNAIKVVQKLLRGGKGRARQRAAAQNKNNQMIKG